MTWAYAQTSGPCYAPLELLDEVIDNILMTGPNPNALKSFPPNWPMVKNAFKALIYAPHMNEEKFIKLIDTYHNTQWILEK